MLRLLLSEDDDNAVRQLGHAGGRATCSSRECDDLTRILTATHLAASVISPLRFAMTSLPSSCQDLLWDGPRQTALGAWPGEDSRILFNTFKLSRSFGDGAGVSSSIRCRFQNVSRVCRGVGFSLDDPQTETTSH